VKFDWLALSPVLLCAVMAVILLMADAFGRTRRWGAITVLSAVTLVGAGILTGVLDGQQRVTMCSTTTTPDAGALERCSFAVDELTIALCGSCWRLRCSCPDGRGLGLRSSLPPGEFHFLLFASVTGALSLAASA
jgi:NADH-quinone oxidoreductase subunit N